MATGVLLLATARRAIQRRPEAFGPLLAGAADSKNTLKGTTRAMARGAAITAAGTAAFTIIGLMAEGPDWAGHRATMAVAMLTAPPTMIVGTEIHARLTPKAHGPGPESALSIWWLGCASVTMVTGGLLATSCAAFAASDNGVAMASGIPVAAAGTIGICRTVDYRATAVAALAAAATAGMGPMLAASG